MFKHVKTLDSRKAIEILHPSTKIIHDASLLKKIGIRSIWNDLHFGDPMLSTPSSLRSYRYDFGVQKL